MNLKERKLFIFAAVILKWVTKGLWHRVMSPKETDKIAIREELDQIVPHAVWRLSFSSTSQKLHTF